MLQKVPETQVQDQMEVIMTNESVALQIVNTVMDKAIEGIGPLASAETLASEYLCDRTYSGNSHRINSLINWETSKNFTSGFLTSLGGLLTLPLNISGALGASWVIQARMAAAIAVINGYSIHEDRVRTLILLSLVGDSVKEVFKAAGVQIGNKLTEQLLKQIPGRVLIEINKKVGFRLVTKAGEKGIVNLFKIVPVVGGMVGGACDASACLAVGRTASSLFSA